MSSNVDECNDLTLVVKEYEQDTVPGVYGKTPDVL